MNILMIMADQLGAQSVGVYGNSSAITPNIDWLAVEGIQFNNCYCNSPLCVPSRASMVTGQFPWKIRSYDNGSELPASFPTFMHYLRSAGYRTILSGKMHFIGPDQLHGFEERLTPDIYPSGFDWTCDWSKGPILNKGSWVKELETSGLSEYTSQMKYDDMVQKQAIDRIKSLHAVSDYRPFFMCVSFTHPHSPYNITKKYWDLFRDTDIDFPACAEKPEDEYNKWINIHHGIGTVPLNEDDIIRARRAYYGMVNYVDDKVGELISCIEKLGIRDDTIIIVTSDHGDMLGEHGMWFKRTFYDGSCKVPFVMSVPGEKQDVSVHEVISLVDLFPTLCECAGVKYDKSLIDGQSFYPFVQGKSSHEKNQAICEYYGEGSLAPMRFLRTEQYKYIYVHGQKPLLFDLKKDPHECKNLAGNPDMKETESELQEELMKGWDPESLHKDVLKSQKGRLLILDAQEEDGKGISWDYKP